MQVEDIRIKLDEILLNNGACLETVSDNSNIFGDVFVDFDDAFDAMIEVENKFFVVLDKIFSVENINPRKIQSGFSSIFCRNKTKWRNFTKEELLNFLVNSSELH